MLENLYNLSGTQLATLVCTVFVLFTWVGAIFIRRFFRVLGRSQPDVNTVADRPAVIAQVFVRCDHYHLGQ